MVAGQNQTRSVDKNLKFCAITSTSHSPLVKSDLWPMWTTARTPTVFALSTIWFKISSAWSSPSSDSTSKLSLSKFIFLKPHSDHLPTLLTNLNQYTMWILFNWLNGFITILVEDFIDVGIDLLIRNVSCKIVNYFWILEKLDCGDRHDSIIDGERWLLVNVHLNVEDWTSIACLCQRNGSSASFNFCFQSGCEFATRTAPVCEKLNGYRFGWAENFRSKVIFRVNLENRGHSLLTETEGTKTGRNPQQAHLQTEHP